MTSSSIYVLGLTASGGWTEAGLGSASGTGVSGPGGVGFVPWIALDASDRPTVVWIDSAPATPQAYLRTFDESLVADLSVTALTAPATVATGQPISVSSTVHNGGNAAAPSVPLRFYLATGTTRGDGDVLLGARAVPGLGIGASHTATTTLTIPVATDAGTYRILAVVDEDGAVGELNEANNLRASGDLAVTQFRPDLVITGLTVPAAAATGRPLAIGHTVRNLGPAAAGAFAVRFYLSADATLDDSDVLLGTRALGGLAANALSTATSTFTVPPIVPAPAGYRVIAVADALGQQAEGDETNNAAVSGVVTVAAYLPDLTVTGVVLPAAAQTNRPLAIRTTLRNAGPAPAGRFVVQFHLSADDTLDGGDVLLGSRIVGTLAAGASSTMTSTFMVPATVPAPATYRVMVVADALGQQTELDETNNTAASEPLAFAPYLPDLTVDSLVLPASAQTGRPFGVRYTVRNIGPAPAPAFVVRFYLSADDVLDGSDVLLGARTLALGAGRASTLTSKFTVPATTSAPATYRVIAVVDGLEQRPELDETNNTAVSGPLSVTLYRPDLTVTDVTTTTAAAAGRPLGIRHTVRNIGPAPAGSFVVRFYLSADDVLDESDVLLGARTIARLAGGASATATSTFTVPADTTVPASYTVIVVADALDQQLELDETNNMAASAPRTFTAFRPDLTVAALLPSEAAQAGRPLAVRNTVANAGPAPAGRFAVQFFLSSDGVVDEGDTLLGTRTIGSLGAGRSTTAVSRFTVPDSVPSGTYQIIALVDPAGQRPELDETNNATMSTLDVS
jgi:subtilase family serine protease